MRNSRTPALAGLGLLAATALLAGCSSGPGAGSDPDGEVAGSIRFQTWSLTPTYAEYLDGVIDAFEEKYPDVTVELLDQPGDGYSEKVLSQASTNTLPDVVNLPPDFALPLARQNLLYDVSKATDLESTYFAGSVDAYRFDGVEGVYGYPWYLGTDVNYWNSTQLDACGLDSANPPKTTDELFAQVVDVDFLDAHGLGLGTGRFDFLALAEVSGEGHHFAVIGILQPLEDHRGVQAAGIRQDYLLHIRHAVRSRVLR